MKPGGAVRRRSGPLILSWLAVLLACASPPKPGQRTFRYQGWLQQVKERFGEAWKPLVYRAVEANDPTGCLYSTKDRRTVIEFTVAPDGTIAGTKVGSSCGVFYLDRVASEAIESVRKVDPPPPGMLDGKSEIELPMAFTLLAITQECKQGAAQRR